MSESFNRNRASLAAARPEKGVQSNVRRSRNALVVSTLLALLLLAWSTWDHIRTRLEQERALATQATGLAAEKVTQRLHSINRRLEGFVNQERSLLDNLVAAPDDAETKDNLLSLLQLHFPQATSALVLDARGIQVANPGAPLGDEDELFLREVVRGERSPVRFAIRRGAVQADFASSWYRDGELAGALLAGLNCAELCPEKALPAAKGHRLHLVPGSSLSPQATNKLQAPPRPGKVLAEAPVGDTGWVLTDRLDAEYLSEIIHSPLTLGLGLGAAFLLTMLALVHWVRSQGRDALVENADLRGNRLRLQAILSATSDGIILTDAQGSIEVFNPAAETMFGHHSEDVLNANLSKLLPDFFSSGNTDAPDQPQDADRARPFVRETRGERKGGVDFPVRLWVNRVRFDEEPHLLIAAQDLTEQERNEEHLAFLEQRDVLTGLLNRREFEKRVTAVLADPKHGPRSPHVLCYIDADRFKLINDTCGHEAGDELLKRLARLIRAKLADARLIARFGGDEFVALFENMTAQEAGYICDGLTQTVRSFMFTWRDRSLNVAISIGLAEFVPEGEGPSSALSKADVACHMAKAHGRDRVHIYHKGDVELVRHHGDMHLVSTINQALSEGRFHLYAQPITPIASKASKQRHFEILVRMVDEDGALVIPDRFIPAAERYILMPAVDRWIINHLFSLQAENLRGWHHMEPDSFLFSVNLSGTSITDEGFLQYLKSQFADWEVPYRSICFEITETAAVSDLEHARSFMQELSALGCSFALDDFGTGLSSYSYLRELPVDYIKIDGSFVRGMSEEPVNYALVESITQISHVLGLQTIAEWAEDKATLNQLRALNVDFAQGFGVGEPTPVCNLTLADAAIPPLLEGTSDDRRLSTHRSRRSTHRPS